MRLFVEYWLLLCDVNFRGLVIPVIVVALIKVEAVPHAEDVGGPPPLALDGVQQLAGAGVRW